MVEEAKSGRNAMSVSIGVSCKRENWKTCLMEAGHVLELNSFADPVAARAYLEHTCVLYPEPNIVVSAEINTPFMRLEGLSSGCLEQMGTGNDTAGESELPHNLLIAMGYNNVNCYLAPSVRFLTSVPFYRKLMREDLGASNKLSAVAALLMQLRAREATWSEMKFMCLEVDDEYRNILVVEDGQIINGMTTMVKTDRQFEEAAEQAFWEGLTQELAGLIAIHHLEEIVVMGRLKDAFIERFADFYQVYLFPYAQSDFYDFEAALGAATIAEGLYGYGIAAEIVERLQIRKAIRGLNEGASPVSVGDAGLALNSEKHFADAPVARN